MSKNDHSQMRPLILFSMRLMQLQQGLAIRVMGFRNQFSWQQS